VDLCGIDDFWPMLFEKYFTFDDLYLAVMGNGIVKGRGLRVGRFSVFFKGSKSMQHTGGDIVVALNI